MQISETVIVIIKFKFIFHSFNGNQLQIIVEKEHIIANKITLAMKNLYHL